MSDNLRGGGGLGNPCISFLCPCFSPLGLGLVDVLGYGHSLTSAALHFTPTPSGLDTLLQYELELLASSDTPMDSMGIFIQDMLEGQRTVFAPENKDVAFLRALFNALYEVWKWTFDTSSKSDGRVDVVENLTCLAHVVARARMWRSCARSLTLSTRGAMKLYYCLGGDVLAVLSVRGRRGKCGVRRMCLLSDRRIWSMCAVIALEPYILF